MTTHTDENTLHADVAVIGGGPGGTTTATYLARAGLKVVLFERERFPRFRIGESLLPLNLPILRELGVEEEMEKRFIRKYAAHFSDRYGARRNRFPFRNGLNKNHPYAYEVERAEFDTMLLENSVKNGVQVHMEWAVREVLFEGARAVGLKAQAVQGGATLTVRCPMVVDASGRVAFLGTRLGMKRDMALASRTAFFSHYEDVARENGEQEGDIQIVSFPHGWFWMIPFKGNTTSVGMVVVDDYLKQRDRIAVEEAVGAVRDDPQLEQAIAGRAADVNDVFLKATIAQTPFVAERMKNARQKFPARSLANFSFVMDRYAGDGYVMVGDSGAFLDPVFSSGVFLTMKSAELAAQAVLCAHRAGDYGARHFRAYERSIRGAQRIFFRFIQGWYNPAFLDLFFYPNDTLRLKDAITTVLAADLFDRRYLWSLKLRIGILFLLARLHRMRLRARRGGRSLVQHIRV